MHEEIEETPDHVACEMPQELRLPEYRTDTYYEEVEKMFTTKRLLNSPSIGNNASLTDLALQVVWGEIDQQKAELILTGLMTFDEQTQVTEDAN